MDRDKLLHLLSDITATPYREVYAREREQLADYLLSLERRLEALEALRQEERAAVAPPLIQCTCGAAKRRGAEAANPGHHAADCAFRLHVADPRPAGIVPNAAERAAVLAYLEEASRESYGDGDNRTGELLEAVWRDISRGEHLRPSSSCTTPPDSPPTPPR